MDAGTVVTPGNHDGVHVGHRALVGAAVERARRAGLRSCAMFFDPHPAAVLSPGSSPALLTTAARRTELLRGAGIDEVRAQPFDEAFAALEPADFVREILIARAGARAVVVGPDFRFGRGRAGNLGTLRSLGHELGLDVDVIEPVELDGARVSSTRIRESLGRGDVDGATRLLGRAHDVDATVVRGDGRGRTIGVPTANLDCDPVVLPADGVYAVVARRLGSGDARRLWGVANLGARPTFRAGRSIEVHLLDFAGDLYGQRVRIAFVQRVREERRFADVAALVGQIRADVQAARGALERTSEEQLRWV